MDVVQMDTLASSLASIIGTKLNLSKADQEIVAYALLTILIFVLNVALIVCFGLMAGVLVLTLSAAFSSALFRIFTGGAHFSSAGFCALFSSLVMLGCALGGQAFSTVGPHGMIALTVITASNLLFSILAYAPVAAPGRPIEDWERRKFRRIALTLLPVWILVLLLLMREHPAVVAASLLGANWQALTLTPVGQRVYGWIDRTVNISGDHHKGGHEHESINHHS